MAYLSSNEPYGRVDDGIGNGLVGGAVVGGLAGRAAYAGAYFKGAKNAGSSFGRNINVNDYFTEGDGVKQRIKGGFQYGNRLGDEAISNLGDGKVGKMAKSSFGSGKRRAISAGVSVLGGALLGAGADAMND